MAKSPGSRKPLQERLADMERRIQVLEQLARAGQATPAPPPASTAPAPTQEPTPPPVLSPPTVPGPLAPPEDRPPVDVERWLRWTGLVLVVLASAFLLNVAIQRGWLTPAIRVAGGLAIGVALYGAGAMARTRSEGWATALQAGGATVVYLMTWAAFQVFDLFGFWLAATVMIGVVAALFTEVFRARDATLGVLASFAGFAIPFLLSTVSGDPAGPGAELVPLLSYLSFFILLTGAVHIAVGWRVFLIPTAGAAVLSLLVALIGTDADPAPSSFEGWMVVVAFALVALMYWAAPALAAPWMQGRRAAFAPSTPAIRLLDDALGTVSHLSGFVLLPTLLGVIAWLWDLDDQGSGWVAIGLAAAAGGVAWMMRRERSLLIINGALASFLVTVGLAFLLPSEAQLVAIAAQAGALHWIATNVEERVPRINAHILAALVGIAILARVTGDFWDGAWTDVVPIVGALAILGWAGWIQETDRNRGIYLLGVYTGTLLLVLHMLGDSDLGQATVTGIWALVGLAVLVGGRMRELRPLELTGVGTLAVVVVKLVAVDLSTVDPFIRVFLFLAVGVLFLGVGWYVRNERREERGERKQGGGDA